MVSSRSYNLFRTMDERLSEGLQEKILKYVNLLVPDIH